MEQKRVVATVTTQSGESQASLESRIGKYWLSKIGIFTLVLGMVLFITYSFQFIGAWGKILVGLLLSGFLVGLGNYLAPRENYKRWAMATIGGGWALLFFTVFAAYHVPIAKVIYNPLVDILCLLLVTTGSISQSLKFKSPVFIFFSYFLGFITITMVEISFYTLLASFLLGVSIVLIARKTGWSWLTLLGLAAVYLTHYFWLEPSINWNETTYVYAGQEGFADALLMPWIGSDWKIYPLIPLEKSLLHQAFLCLYWLLFTTVGFAKTRHEKQDENLTFSLILANSFIFIGSYIHHLHVYYPDFKSLFLLAMASILLGFFVVEQKLIRKLLSDFYLALSVSLFSLAIPMYFDGPWVTYGWVVASVVLAWLGVRHHRFLLRVISSVLAIFVLGRLFIFDYLERDVLFHLLMPIRNSFLLFSIAAVSFFATSWMYEKSDVEEDEKRIKENIFLIAASILFGIGCLIGGLRAATSNIWILEGIFLIAWGALSRRFPLKVMSLIFFTFAAFRLHSVDCNLEILKIFSDFKIALRLLTSGLSIALVIMLADWLRMKKRTIELERWLFPTLNIGGGLLLLRYFYDQGISSWVSIIWGIIAFIFIIYGFAVKERISRWMGLGMFGLVILRLFIHDFPRLETIYRIISFIGLGAIFIAASFIYSYFSKLFLGDSNKSQA